MQIQTWKVEGRRRPLPVQQHPSVQAHRGSGSVLITDAASGCLPKAEFSTAISYLLPIQDSRGSAPCGSVLLGVSKVIPGSPASSLCTQVVTINLFPRKIANVFPTLKLSQVADSKCPMPNAQEIAHDAQELPFLSDVR